VTQPDPQVTAEVLAGLEATSASPSARGTAWQLTPATVVTAGATRAGVIFDGDGVLGGVATPVTVTSLIGYLAVGARVLVLRVPPSGNYVVADLSGATAVRDAVADTVTVTDSSQWTFPSCGTSFVAPASGKVLINWSSEMVTTGGFFLVGPQVTLGPDVGATDDVHTGWDVSTADRFIRTGTTSPVRFGAADLCEGLTPGATYAVTLWHQISFGQTGTGTRRIVTVTPTR
jgi:hypothetical protein